MAATIARFWPSRIPLWRINKSALSAAVGLFCRIHPAQHFLEVVLDRFVAEAGPSLQRLAVAYQDRAAAGLQDRFRLEGLDDAAGIAAADPEQGRELFVRQRHDNIAVAALHRREEPFRGALLDGKEPIAGPRLRPLA